MGRQKPGKPRRPRPAESHDHAGWQMPEGFAHPGNRPVDERLLEGITGAAFERCSSCQDPLLTLLVEDEVTSARLVEMALGAMINILGGDIPESELAPDAPHQDNPEFRRLGRAALGKTTDGLYRECALMPPVERRAAVNSALDILTAYHAMH